MKEGFWRNQYKPDLPMPEAAAAPWEGKTEFLSTLEKIEATAQQVAYRGFSICRICKKMNGTREFEHRNWVWPSGFRHYIEDHNVKPSEEFIKMISTSTT